MQKNLFKIFIRLILTNPDLLIHSILRRTNSYWYIYYKRKNYYKRLLESFVGPVSFSTTTSISFPFSTSTSFSFCFSFSFSLVTFPPAAFSTFPPPTIHWPSSSSSDIRWSAMSLVLLTKHFRCLVTWNRAPRIWEIFVRTLLLWSHCSFRISANSLSVADGTARSSSSSSGSDSFAFPFSNVFAFFNGPDSVSTVQDVLPL